MNKLYRFLLYKLKKNVSVMQNFELLYNIRWGEKKANYLLVPHLPWRVDNELGVSYDSYIHPTPV